MSSPLQAPRRRPTCARPTAVLAVLTLVTVFAMTVTTMTPAHAVRPAAAAAVSRNAMSPHPASTPATFGVAEPGAPTDLSGVRTLTTQLGQAPSLVMWYAPWSTRSDFPSAAVAAVTSSGATPEITWEAWDPAAGADQPAYRLAAIAGGAYDAYISRWAVQARAARTRVVIRFGHEMNGSWYPWAEQANGNAPGDFVRAFRHVHDLFVAARATNVRWAWSPNVSFPGSNALSGLYPGDAYVDQVALDGYNWSTLLPGTSWTTFWGVFGPTVAEVQELTSRPVVVGETGCTEMGGDKAVWVTDMFAALAAHPEIRGVTWFDFDKETNWRIDSSPASLKAFRTGVATFH